MTSLPLLSKLPSVPAISEEVKGPRADAVSWGSLCSGTVLGALPAARNPARLAEWPFTGGERGSARTRRLPQTSQPGGEGVGTQSRSEGLTAYSCPGSPPGI